MQKKTKKILIDAALLTVLLVAFIFLIKLFNRPMNIGLQQNITITDGVAVPAQATTSFKVDRSGKYVIHAKWWPTEKLGFVTGIIVTDESGKQVFGLTGNKVDSASTPIKLKKGEEYTATFTFITSYDQFDDFTEAHFEPEDVISKGGTEFISDASYNVHYAIEVHVDYDMFYIVLILMALAFGLILARIIALGIRKGESDKAIYDERQYLVRGKGFKYGYFILLVGGAIVLIISAVANIPIYIIQLAWAIIILSGLTVPVVFFIWNDAYYALNENRSVYIGVFVLGALGNLAIGLAGVIRNGFVTRYYSLNLNSVNLMLVVALIVLSVTMIAKNIKDKRGDEE